MLAGTSFHCWMPLLYMRETESPVSQKPQVTGWFYLQVVAIAWAPRTMLYWISVFIVTEVAKVQQWAYGQWQCFLHHQWEGLAKEELRLVPKGKSANGPVANVGLAVALGNLCPVQAGYRGSSKACFTWLLLDLLQFPPFLHVFPFKNSMRHWHFWKVDHF